MFTIVGTSTCIT